MDTNVTPKNVTPKKPSKVGAFFYGLLVMLIYLVIVSVPQFFVIIPVTMEVIMESQGDMTRYMDIYMAKLAEHSTALTIATSVGTIIAVLVTVIWYFFGVYRKNKKAGQIEKVAPKLKNVKSILFLVLGSIAAYAVAILIYFGLASIMPNMMEVYQAAMNSTLGGVEILGLILPIVLAPIGEETALRGLVMTRTKKSFGLAGCIILSGIFFGIYHMNPIQGLYAIPIGVFYGFVAYKYKSVIPAIICHLINNVLGTIFAGLFGNPIVDVAIIVVFGAVTVFLGTKIDFINEKMINEKETLKNE